MISSFKKLQVFKLLYLDIFVHFCYLLSRPPTSTIPARWYRKHFNQYRKKLTVYTRVKAEVFRKFFKSKVGGGGQLIRGPTFWLMKG